MNPKEKATELVSRLRLTGLKCKETNYYSFDLQFGKVLAIAAVMEQLEEHSCQTFNSERHRYWSEVKSEIEKL